MIQTSRWKFDCFSTVEVEKIMSGVHEFLGVSLGVYQVNGKVQSNPGRVRNGSDPSEMTVCVTPPRKEPRPAEAICLR